MTRLSAAILRTTSVAALIAAMPLHAFAQTAKPAPEAVEEVVVTGTRLGTTGFTTPTPVTTLDATQLQNRATNNVAEALNQLPQLRGSTVANATRSPSADEGTGGQNLLSMRGLGSTRTLVLLDGNRLPRTNNSGSTDLNILPQSLIKRVDVVTGGASASYGSEAVSGVINFILDTKFEGFKGSINGGVTTYGDNESGHITLAYGRSLGERGRIIASAEYEQEGRVGFSNHPNGRNWFDHAQGVYNNPVSGTLPRLLVVPDIRQPNAAPGGLITSGPLRGMQFGPGGTVIPFNGGTTPFAANTSGGDGIRVGAQLAPDAHRMSLFSHAEYDVTDNLVAYVEGMFSRSESESVSFPEYQYLSSGQYTIFRDNAYLPAAVTAMFAANPTLQSFTVGRIGDDMPPLTIHQTTTLGRISGGLKGTFGDGWGYDAGATYSEVQQNLDRLSTINRNVYAAADAVRNSAGQIVCRSNLTGGDPSCVPMNIFGPGSVSAEAGDYVTGWNEGHTNFKQAAVSANIRGDLGQWFELPAGPVAVAFGAHYREERVDRVVDPLSATYVNCNGTNVRGCPAAMNPGTLYGGYLSYNPSPLKGKVTVGEAYAEFGVPILKDLAFAQQLNMTVAGRATDYNTSGMTYTWKLGVNWSINDDLRLRYTRSQDIRAPNMLELFGAGGSSGTQSTLPGSTAVYTGPTYLVANRTLSGIGNLDLEPEVALTDTVGGVYRPSWLPGLQVAVDYYKIKIKDAIATAGSVAIIDNCFLGNQTYCALITLNNGATPVTSTTQIPPNAVGLTLRSAPANIAMLSTSGIDFDVAYSRSLGAGTLTLRAMANYLLTAENSSRAATNYKLVGSMEQAASWPEWTGSLSLDYSGERWSLFLQERLISEGYRNPNFVAGVDIAENKVPLVAYTDATVTYKLDPIRGGDVSVYAGVKNLFDKAPPYTGITTTTSANITNYTLYDVLGRRYTVGLRFKW